MGAGWIAGVTTAVNAASQGEREPGLPLDQRIKPLTPRQRRTAALAALLAVTFWAGNATGSGEGTQQVAPAGITAEQVTEANKYSRIVQAEVRANLDKFAKAPQQRTYIWRSQDRENPFVQGALDDMYYDLGVYEQSLTQEAAPETLQLTAPEAASLALEGVTELKANVRRFDITVNGQRATLEERVFNLRTAGDTLIPYVHLVAQPPASGPR